MPSNFIKYRPQRGHSTPAPDEGPALLSMYRTMTVVRLFEEAIATAIDAGEIGCPTHLCIGQEAVAAGICQVLTRDDSAFGNHRSHGHYLAKGGDLKALAAEIFGKVTGCSRGRGGSMHLISVESGFMGSVPIVSATIPLAVGAAYAFHVRREPRVAVSFFGDGAMEEGQFHEAMNFASLKKLPVLFVCENNWHSSHLRLEDRRSEDNLTDAAAAHALPSIVVDGNDALSVYRAAKSSADRARRGEGPTFIECRTYRWRGHVGSKWDLDFGIRDRDEVQAWRDHDPLKIAEAQAVAAGFAAESGLEEVRAGAASAVAEAMAFARSSPYPDPSELASFVFAGGQVARP